MNVLPDIKYEHDYIRVVYEFIIAKLRNNKKTIEKELTLIITKLSLIKKKIINEKKVSLEIEKVISIMLNRIEDLENKYLKIVEEEDSLYRCLDDRLNTINLIDSKYNKNDSNEEVVNNSSVINNKLNTSTTKTESIAFINLKKFLDKKLTNLLLDFFLKERYINTANLFIEEADIKDTIELTLYLDYQKIIESMKNKDLLEALNWSNQNKNKLIKINSNLKFKLIKQQFIEIYKSSDALSLDENNQYMSCISFAKENFTSEEIQNNLEEMQELMSLLGIKRNKINLFPKLENLLSDNRWNVLHEEFKSTFYSTYNVKSISNSLEYFFYCGLLALKTSFCNNNNKNNNNNNNNLKSNIKENLKIGNIINKFINNISKSNYNKVTTKDYNNNCPLCHTEIAEIAKSLPISQHDISSLLCKKTKKVMDSSNPPLATKKGYLFSTNYILSEIEKNPNKTYFCKEEGVNYKLNDFIKVYIV